ncbi:DUF924 family protein [Massilia sp. TS11]|uniref:DUF924 family protein n=1 Tax=Massilia sp. TS11 TaxID=2908003 RepID=UPI001EDC8C07|nr:DUF924 family protein [Massilia sp. TS11]MCG2585285.1 DUF924 domain-containing protein [Massilia sp. TS11]
MQPQDVLDFWFLPAADPRHGQQRAEWFRKDPAFDASIRNQFGPTISQAVNGGLRDWDAQGPGGALARIIVLDQFTRNAGRDTAAAFAGDTLALAAAQALVASGADRALTPLQRWFAYLPFEHAESAAMQAQSVALFSALAEADPSLAGALDYAHRHRGVIARFGRFPHRNAILGRASSADELAYLAQPGSGF